MLSVVIPAFDEEDAIGQTVRTVRETLAASDIAPLKSSLSMTVLPTERRRSPQQKVLT